MFVLGWLYIIDDEAVPNILKIGFSTKNRSFHAIELDGANSGSPYRVVYTAFVEEPSYIEQAAHLILASKREDNGWFGCSHADAISAIRTCAKSILIEHDNSAEYQRPEERTQMIGWPRNAAEAGNAEAQYWYGQYHFSGPYIFDDVPEDYKKDDKEAAKWFRLAAEQGVADAQTKLAGMYEYGQGVPYDYALAAYWFRMAAEQGDVHGQWRLCDMYNKGRGVGQDEEQSVYWCRKAADQNNAIGQYMLGDKYKDGLGVEQDDEQAVYWYRKAADQDDSEGQCLLADMYSKGRGVEKDDEQAVYWYRKAADRGYLGAEEALERFGINWEDELRNQK
jgi:TPR repeat protein